MTLEQAIDYAPADQLLEWVSATPPAGSGVREVAGGLLEGLGSR